MRTFVRKSVAVRRGVLGSLEQIVEYLVDIVVVHVGKGGTCTVKLYSNMYKQVTFSHCFHTCFSFTK